MKIWKCKPFLIWTQIVIMDSSQYPLSKHIAPLCEIIHNPVIRCNGSDLETTILNKTVAAPKGKTAGNKNIYLYIYMYRIVQTLLLMSIRNVRLHVAWYSHNGWMPLLGLHSIRGINDTMTTFGWCKSLSMSKSQWQMMTPPRKTLPKTHSVLC